MIKISRFFIISVFSFDDSARASKTIACLKFANKSNSFLIFKSPLSGLFLKSRLSHFGPPTAPNRIASEWLIFLRVSFVSGESYSSTEMPPTNSSLTLIFKSVFSLNQSKIFRASTDIS